MEDENDFDLLSGSDEEFDNPPGSDEEFDNPPGSDEEFDNPPGSDEEFDNSPPGSDEELMVIDSDDSDEESEGRCVKVRNDVDSDEVGDDVEMCNAGGHFENDDNLKALILTPTRELAVQVT